jgi:uncharacterized 2Fe-2S/4Fe-4S cluster protein (DUF4445 family)
MRPVNGHLVVFSPSGKRGRVAARPTVLGAARTRGVDLDSVCGGRAICGRCRIEVAEGEMPKHGIVSRAEHLESATQAELAYGQSHPAFTSGSRLGCQARICGDIAIDVPANSQVHHQVVRKPHEDHDIVIDPVVQAYFVEVAEPDMHDPSGDLERLCAALAREWGWKILPRALPALVSLQSARARAGGRSRWRWREGRETLRYGAVPDGLTGWPSTWARPRSQRTCAPLAAAKCCQRRAHESANPLART